MEDLVPRRRLLGRRRRIDPQDLVVQTIAEHAESLLRVARRYTDCPADAEDAYQRAMEVFVKSAHRLDPATAHRWLHTVLKHECFAVREQRAALVGVGDEEALDALDDGRCVASVEERWERVDELTRAAEALRRCKPAEVTALVLKAQGLSYHEIAERQGWTYTKVNRSLTEGRRAFLARYAGIESGAECERWAPALSAIADGEASARDLAEARPHLRNCTGCRATLAAMRAGDGAVRGLLPPVAAAPVLARLAEAWLAVQERAAASLARGQAAVEAATTGKLAAATASVAVLAGGGAVAERNLGDEPARAAGVERQVDAPAAAADSLTRRADPRPTAVARAEPGPAPDANGQGEEPRRAAAPERLDPPADDAAFAPEGAAAPRASPQPGRGAPPSTRTTAKPPGSAATGGEFGFAP